MPPPQSVVDANRPQKGEPPAVCLCLALAIITTVIYFAVLSSAGHSADWLLIFVSAFWILTGLALFGGDLGFGGEKRGPSTRREPSAAAWDNENQEMEALGMPILLLQLHPDFAEIRRTLQQALDGNPPEGVNIRQLLLIIRDHPTLVPLRDSPVYQTLLARYNLRPTPERTPRQNRRTARH